MSVIENICGIQPSNFVKPDISSNPNFIFKNDINYSAKQLFDSEGNTVFVNSYVECQHYVLGGWDFTPIKNLETDLQTSLLYVMIFLVAITFFKRKFRVLKWK
jgi:hypothetical protein